MSLFKRLIAVLFLLPCNVVAQEATAQFGGGDTPFLIRSTTDITILEPVIERFAQSHPELTITYEQWGSNALFVRSQNDCQDGMAAADAVFSSAVQHMVWLVNAACAHPHRSAATQSLPSARRWRDEVWGITSEPAVIVYNKRLLSADDVPRSRFALLDALRARPGIFQKRIATYDISASGLGYLFAYSDSLEATTFGSMLESFARVDAVATCCSAKIIDDVASGRFLIAYNVLGSYVDSFATEDVGIILPEDYTLILSRGYMIPKGSAQKEASIALLEFLLSSEAQQLLADAGLVSDMIATDTGLPPSARRPIPLSPALLVSLDPHRRELLLNLWADALRSNNVP